MGALRFLDVGCGDTSMIESGTDFFLVDCYNIEYYSNLLPNIKYIDAVFITHQHRDHFSGLKYLADNDFHIQNLIYSPYERRRGDNSVEYDEWLEFEDLKTRFEQKGTKTYTPFRQSDFNSPWWSTGEVWFKILGPIESVANSDTREIHDASLVILAKMGKRSCLFAGDASDELLEQIASKTINYCSDILHASHHGSINGACLPFLQKGSPEYTVISTSSGVHQNVPHREALSNYSRHTQRLVYRTDHDGPILNFKF